MNVSPLEFSRIAISLVDDGSKRSWTVGNVKVSTSVLSNQADKSLHSVTHGQAKLIYARTGTVFGMYFDFFYL